MFVWGVTLFITELDELTQEDLNVVNAQEELKGLINNF